MGLFGLFLPRWARRFAVVLIVSGVGALLAGRLFVWPPTDLDADGRVDAIVMFQGGEGERLLQVESLLAAGVSDVAIIPEGHFMGLPHLCGRHETHEVICGSPAVANTAGEAAFFAAVARDRGFERLAIVTSDYHVTRAGQELDRCFDGHLVQAPAEPDLARHVHAGRVAHEALGLFQAFLRATCVAPGWYEDGTPVGRR